MWGQRCIVPYEVICRMNAAAWANLEARVTKRILSYQCVGINVTVRRDDIVDTGDIMYTFMFDKDPGELNLLSLLEN